MGQSPFRKVTLQQPASRSVCKRLGWLPGQLRLKSIHTISSDSAASLSTSSVILQCPQLLFSLEELPDPSHFPAIRFRKSARTCLSTFSALKKPHKQKLKLTIRSVIVIRKSSLDRRARNLGGGKADSQILFNQAIDTIRV